MKRWTNGLPGATKRLGAKMALRGLAASESWVHADTHDGPEQIAPLQRPDTLMQLLRSSILEVHLVPHGRAIHFGTWRRFAATPNGRDRSEADMPQASGGCRSDEIDPLLTCGSVLSSIQGVRARKADMPIIIDLRHPGRNDAMKKLAFVLAAAVAALFGAGLHADDYPSRPITIVNVFGPGSGSD